jgi:CheY-like chemotaxis protein
MDKGKILVVDDDVDIRDSLKEILQGRDYAVVTAGSRKEGMEKIRGEEPELIILDVVMDSWQDGLDMARDLKKDSRLRDIPILMLTGIMEHRGIDLEPTAGDPQWCPVEGFLHKPIEPDLLFAEVERLLGE